MKPVASRSPRPDFERIDRQLAWSFLGGLGMLAAAIILFGSVLYQRVVRDERQRLCTVIAHLLAPGVESVKASGSFRLQHMASQVRQQDPAIAYIRVIDSEGLLVHDGPEPDAVARGDEVARAQVNATDVLVYQQSIGSTSVTEIVTRLQGGYQGQWTGALRIGVYQEPLSVITTRGTLIIGGLIAFLLVLAWPLTRWVGRRLGAPVQTLARDFAGVMEHAPLHVAIEDETGRIDRASLTFQQKFEIDLDAHPKMADLLPSESLERLNEKPEIQVTLNGEPHILHITRFPVLLAPDGKVLRSGFVGTDLTAWRRDQAERLRLAAAVESTEDAILITEPSKGVVYANPALYRQTGFTESDVLGVEPAELLAAEEASRNELAHIDPTKDWRGSITARRQPEDTWACSLAISPIEVEGQLRAQVWIARDVSREAELEAQLRQSQKLEAIGQLAGGIAHDFNNLLTVVISASELLALAPLAPEHKNNLRMISEAGNRAASLTRQLLAFGRRQMLDIRELKLNDVLSGALSLLRRVIGATIGLRFTPGPDLWVVRGDVGQFEQVLMNLAINARDAMPHGGTLSVSTENARLQSTAAADGTVAPAGDYVIVAIADTGIGMSKETQRRIFEPFFTTKGLGQGTGLGLATVLGIVKQSGGYIWVDSEPNVGTTFRIAFPRVVPSETTKPEEKPLVQFAPGSGENILLVEDEPLVRDVVEKMLRSAGYAVRVAEDGQEALEHIAREGLPNLVLTDLVMPRMGGIALATQLQEKAPHLPILFMSGYSADALDLGTFANMELIWKPPTTPALLSAVRKALKT